jgi:hypothetical protein
MLAKNEDKYEDINYSTSIGWAYFAKKDFNTLLAPQVLYAYGDAPVSAVGVILDGYSVKGGCTIGGTLYLNAIAPAGGVRVSISSSDGQKAIVSPGYIDIPEGGKTGRFVVSTIIIPQGGSATTVSISADSTTSTSGGATLEITP